MQPRRDVPGLDDVEARRVGRDADEALEGVRGGAVDVTRLRLEMLRSEPKIRQPTENPRSCPEHRAAWVTQQVRVEGEGDSCCERLDELLVRAPRLRTTELPGRDDEPHRAIAAQQLDDAANPLRRGQQPVEQRDPPGVTVLPVRAALRMHLEDGVVAVEHAGSGQLDERAQITAGILDAVDHRAREPLPDLGLQQVGAAVDQRDHEVVGLGNSDEPIFDVEPDLGVVHVRHHEHAGVRPRAQEPRLPTIRRELRPRQQRARGCNESTGRRHLGRKQSGRG